MVVGFTSNVPRPFAGDSGKSSDEDGEDEEAGGSSEDQEITPAKGRKVGQAAGSRTTAVLTLICEI